MHFDSVFLLIYFCYVFSWLEKWPSKFNGFGKPKNRYFILRDNLLCYYQTKPRLDVDYQRVKIFHITEQTKLEICMNMFQRCLRISSPQATETLWLRLWENSRHATLWLQALRQSIALQTAKKLSLSSTIKTLWFPDISSETRCEIISADATMLGDIYVKTALFELQRPATESHPSTISYTVDLITNEVEKMQLEVSNLFHLFISVALLMGFCSQLMLPNESPFNESQLRCAKIYGDMLLLGGSGGFIGVGIVAKTVDSRPRRVLYVLHCRPGPLTTSSTTPSSDDLLLSHSATAEVQFFAWAEHTDIFVAADNQRCLTFWHLRKERHADDLVNSPPPSNQRPDFSYCKPELHSSFRLQDIDPDGRYTEERITAIYFLQEQCYLIVSTTMRLLLLEVAYISQRRTNAEKFQSQHENKFGVVGYVELDNVSEKGQQGLFALNVVDPVLPTRSPGLERSLSHRSTSFLERRIVHWRVTRCIDDVSRTYPEGTTNSEDGNDSCQVLREEWSNERFNSLLRNMRSIC
jgi:hypothetical protein